MPLIYSFVARSNTVLADYTAYTGNFSVVAIQVRGLAGRGDGQGRKAQLTKPDLAGTCCRRRPPPSRSQALEKGAQGPNAKFTYSCDGHSELGAGLRACACRAVSVGGALPASSNRTQPPDNNCSCSARLLQPSTTCHQMATVSGGVGSQALAAAKEQHAGAGVGHSRPGWQGGNPAGRPGVCLAARS